MKQGKRELNKLQCRSRILKVSRQLFTAKGYDNTTLDDIARGAEISRATLYNYFSNKEDLLLGIAENALDEIRHLVNVELADEPSSLVRLRHALESLALDSIRYIALTRRIFYLNATPGSELHDTRRELMDLLEKLIREAQEQGSLRRDLSAGELAESFFGVFLLAQFCWDDIDTYTPDECRAKVGRTIDRVLSGLDASHEAN